jgi:hypothetical protein
LRKLEERFADELVVIGVHSAKFPAEQATENLRQAVMRHNIEHPVVNDRDFLLWRAYAVRAWPTIAIIDPAGKVIGMHAGEFSTEPIAEFIRGVIATFDAEGRLDRSPLRLERGAPPEAFLSFPGKLRADEASGRLFIADTNHHRIVETDLDGRVFRLFGSGQPGFDDGPPGEARFHQPQGVVVAGDRLLVADTENHAIREVHLATGSVQTLAGTGEQARQFHPGGPGREVALSSPWDLVVVGGTAYIAMAGFHQLWSLDLESLEARPFAGSGREEILDGPPERAILAQPSGIDSDGERLYFADSETSSIRAADLPTGRVSTLVGEGLFEFGDVDGIGETVRLQHPLGLCWHDGTLLVCDSYNHKIKRVDPGTRAVTTLHGTGHPGRRDGDGREAEFWEPGGLDVARGRLYVADTNNQAVRVVELASGEVRTLEIE